MLTKQGKARYRIEVISDECRGCHLCELACSFYKTGVFKLSNSRVNVKRDIDRIERYEVNLLDACDGCGWCARFCNFDAVKIAGS